MIAKADGRRNVAIIAAEPLFCWGLASALENTFTVVGSAGSVETGQRLLSTYTPPLAIVTLTPPLPYSAVEDICASLISAHPATATLALVQQGDGVSVRIASRCGARGIYATSVHPTVIPNVLLRLAAGEFDVHPSLVEHLIDGQREMGTHREGTRLTERELTALQLLARGYTSRDIAAVLEATPKAIDLTIERATHRLEAHHRAHAIAIAVRRGLLS